MSFIQLFDSLTAEKLRSKACAKWQNYPADVLPLWVADMDFPVSDKIKDALRAYADSDNFGYPAMDGHPGVKEATLKRLSERHGWTLEAKDLSLINGIVPGLFLSVMALSSAQDEVIVPSPIYGPFKMAIEMTGRKGVFVPLLEPDYELDFDALEKSVTPASRILMLCNPHNPVGRVFRRDELEKLADFALRHRLWVVSDELHSDLIFSGHKHIPFATLGHEIAQRTLTLFGPTKTFNIAGLKIGFAAAQNPELLNRFETVGAGLMGKPNVFAQTALVAAFNEGDAWLNETLSYLEANRDFIGEYLKTHLPQIGYRAAEGTYLAWLDMRKLELENPEAFALEQAKVALNNGAWFGPGGEGFLRLNFATSRGILSEALERLKTAIHAR